MTLSRFWFLRSFSSSGTSLLLSANSKTLHLLSPIRRRVRRRFPGKFIRSLPVPATPSLATFSRRPISPISLIGRIGPTESITATTTVTATIFGADLGRSSLRGAEEIHEACATRVFTTNAESNEP